MIGESLDSVSEPTSEESATEHDMDEGDSSNNNNSAMVLAEHDGVQATKSFSLELRHPSLL